ncbi:23S rRNA (guanosine(2251)-2'-O)-methyltransferase RlmB [Kordiimonas pumila]|uniref:23S rRNA (Guanosine(2251)-2'-O)-methyltransferase RlmB n=1 Tax=Kordiimonas pumila TaxID=2161677 RepID=A0ABV7D8B9_9PROT|nr:23S rRNA (guanosine(2251)-2'-O)-methyltransferase RlmB [Kordiimonas pumila]
MNARKNNNTRTHGRKADDRSASKAFTGKPASEKKHYSKGPRDSAPQIRLRSPDGYFLFGRNSVYAALQNPRRECVQLIGTSKALAEISLPTNRQKIYTTPTEPSALDTCVPPGAPHQGIILEVRPLPGIPLDTLAPVDGQKNIILMLDQVTDPQNVGACIRSAVAFGARAVITQDRNSPSETGALARATAGAIETVHWAQATNLSQALDELKDLGYWHVGLDGNTKTSIRALNMGDNIVIVMGSEGTGLRPLVRKNCDAIACIPMTDAVESLNVSAAAAIALYELSKT